MDAIRFEGVQKAFGPHVVLSGLDLAIPKGGITVLIGRSGTGKSVTLKHAMGLLRPDAGRIWVGSEEVTSLTRRQLRTLRLRFGMVFQHGALFDSMTVRENISFPLREHTKLSDREIEERVKGVLAPVGLLFAIDKLPGELSGGMRKRVALARALVHRPEILLYDEPTTGLDPILTAQVDRLIRDTQDRFPEMTSVVISHDMKATFRIADHVAFLHDGKVLLAGPPEVLETTDDPRVRQFVEGRLDGPIDVE